MPNPKSKRRGKRGGGAVGALVAVWRAAPYMVLTGFVFVVAAYLSLVNLDYAGLWHDEGATAAVGKALNLQGDIVGWDGRNLAAGGIDGNILNDDLRDVYPPLSYLLNAAGFAVAGVNEIGARLPHALAGLLALLVFYLLLRHTLPAQPRLVFILFCFSALSAQLLMFFRQSRYYAAMVLLLILLLYLYERYWRTKNPLFLAALSLATAAMFFNHYASVGAAGLTLAAYHLLLRAKQTTGREWGMFSAAAVFPLLAGLAYFYFLGFFDGDGGGESSGEELSGNVFGVKRSESSIGYFERVQQEIGGGDNYHGALPYPLLKIYVYFREPFRTDWISWPVFLWFAGVWALWLWRFWKVAPPPAARQQERKNPRRGRSNFLDDGEFRAGSALVLFGALFVVFSALLSVQALWRHGLADIRYYIGALPFLLVMKGLFVEWLWRRQQIAGIAAFVVLALTNIAATPLQIQPLFGGNKIAPHLFLYAAEIHRPYPDPGRAAAVYLLRHAKKDALVYTKDFSDREMLTFYVGEHVRLCCHISADSHIVDKVDAVTRVGAIPDWVVSFGKSDEPDFAATYAPAAALKVRHYPTQRPEIMYHLFSPSSQRPGVFIWKRVE